MHLTRFHRWGTLALLSSGSLLFAFQNCSQQITSSGSGTEGELFVPLVPSFEGPVDIEALEGEKIQVRVDLSGKVSNPTSLDWKLVSYDPQLNVQKDFASTSGAVPVAAGTNRVQIELTSTGDNVADSSRLYILKAAVGAESLPDMSLRIRDKDKPKVAVGGAHVCYVLNGGRLQCWGENLHGQLGNGSQTRRDKNNPVTVIASGVIEVALGARHSCALLRGGELRCWGHNNFGQAGRDPRPTNDNDVRLFTPLTVFKSGVRSVAAGGDHTCAILDTGALQCWGQNNAGQVGVRAVPMDGKPRTVIESGVNSVALGPKKSCAILGAGELWCWGTDDGYSEPGSQDFWPVPQRIFSSGILSATIGSEQTCVLHQRGELQCWGRNIYGSVGNGTRLPTPTPETILATGVTAIAAGSLHTCALRNGGERLCWGRNAVGQLGIPLGADVDRTEPVSAESGALSLAAGGLHTCVMLESGPVCWGG